MCNQKKAMGRIARNFIVSVFLSTAWGATVISGFAQPANDNFANAEVISGAAGTITGDNLGATSETGEPVHVGLPTAAGASVWYRWTAPTDGAFSFDTVGSDFDTVLAVYSGNSLTTLVSLAGNDDFDATIAGPSRVTFLAKAGTVYQIAVDGYDFGFGAGSMQGNIVLNWGSGFSAGTFQFTKANYVVSDGEDFPAAWTSMGPQATADLGARITVTRTFGSVGKVSVGYHVDTAFYTNILMTNIYGTNIFSTNIDSLGTITFTNILSTNFTSTNFYQNLVDGRYVSGCGVLSSSNITITTINGISRTSRTNYGAVALTNDEPCLGDQFFASVTIFTNTAGLLATNFTTTNIFCIATITNEVAPAAPFFIPVDGTLEFDDYQMSKTFLVKNVGFKYNFSRPANGVLSLTLTNATLDPLETAPIASPTFSANASTIEVKRFDIGAIPGQNESLPSRNTPCTSQSFIFNFERATLRAGETPNHRFVVFREGTNSGACSVSYRVDFRYSIYEYGENRFSGLLEAGSDIATPLNPNISTQNNPFGNYPSAQPPDFFGANGAPELTGTLSWGANDFTAKNIDVVFADDNLVEFNEDILVQLYNPNPAASLNPNGAPPTPGGVVGQVGRAILTILYDDQPAGAFDRTFNTDNSAGTDPYPNNPNPGANGTVFTTAMQADGKSIIGGTFSAYNGIAAKRMARVLNNGLFDSTFNPGSGANDAVTASAISPDGKILVGGAFTAINGIGRHSIARLNIDGSVDKTYLPGSGANGTVWSIVLQPDGKALIGGFFTSVNGTNRNHIARLNADGSLDATFNPGTGVNGDVFALALQPDGKVFIGGEFTSVAGTTRNSIARLNADGTLDASFDPGTGTLDLEAQETGIVYSLALQQDGKIILGGAFDFINLESRSSIARMNANGSLDTTFDPGSGADHTVYSIKLQPDGKALIGGLFASYNSTRRKGIARLFSDGSLDTSFMDTAYNQFAGLVNPYFTEFNSPLTNNTRGYVYSMSLQADGAVIIGGGFAHGGGGSTRDGIRPRQNMARLIGGATPGPGNIELAYSTYSATENGNQMYVTLARTNGNLGPASATFAPVTLPGGAGAAVQGVDYNFNGAKYGNPTWRTTWPADTWMQMDGLSGKNNATFSVLGNGLTYTPDLDDVFIDLLDNSSVDGNKSFNFELTHPNGSDVFFLGGENIPLGVALGRALSTATIIDNDQPYGVLKFSSPTYTVNENGGSAQLNVIRENGSVGPVTVRYAIALTNGTATYGLDYLTNKANLLSFGEGETNKPIFIPIINDTVAEFDETIHVFLTIPTGGATLNTNSDKAVVTIIDDDFDAGRLDIISATFATNESKEFATISVKRTHGNVGAISVQCAATDGTATSGLDFTAVTNTLSWADGDTSIKTLTVPIINDSLVEGNETVNLRLFDPIVAGVTNNTALGPQSTAVLTIEDDDFPGELRFSVPNFLVNENGGSAIITVVRVNGAAEPVTIHYSTLDGSAIKGIHYATNSGLLYFAPGQVSATFTVSIIDDFGITNNNRVVNLVLSNPSPTVLFQTNATLTIVDNESINEIAGTVDSSFNSAAGVNGFVYALALQTNGNLLIGGDFTAVNQVPRKRIGRLKPNGSFDSTFLSIDPTTGANDSVRSIITQTDGRIVVGGLFTQFNGNPRNRISRVNLDGSTDSIFDPGAGANGPVYSLAETFIGPSDVPDNRRVLVAGNFTSFDSISRNGFVRLLNNGKVDGSFNIGSGVNGTNGAIYCMALQIDGKIIIGGDFNSFNGVPCAHMARLNVDGSVDSSFNVGIGPNDSVRSIAIQTDGKIVIGGLFTSVSSVPFNHVARLDGNGSPDNSFTPGVGANDSVYAIALQVDGKILIGGQFTEASGVTRNRLTRLNSDGTVDPTINFGEGANSFISSVLVQPTDGKILIGGGFTEFDGTPRPHLARLHGGSMTGSGTLEFVTSQFEVNENATNVVITVRRRGSTGSTNVGPVYVDFSTSDGSAESGSDYIGITNTLVFPVGETRQTILIPIINDDLVEPSETVNLTLSNPTDAALGHQPTATLTILNDDSAISFGSSTYRFAENEPSGNAIIDIIRTGSAIGTASVEFLTTTNGTATPDVDFGVVTNILVEFADGETNKSVQVPLLNDSIIEPDETVSLALTNVVGAVFSTPINATLSIVDDDSGFGELTFLQSSYLVSETGAVATITVIRTNGSSGFVTVDYATGFGSATAGLDYVATNGTISFGPGELSKSFFVRILDDNIPEGNETVPLILSNPAGGAIIAGSNSVPLIIVDDEIALSFSTPSYVVNEGDGGATITVLRLSGTNGSVTVFYETADITATNGLDYIGLTNSATATNKLVFAAGETFKTFTVPILEDSLVEGDESFSVRLFGPSGGAQLASPSNAIVTIVDNDSSFSFSTNNFVVDESGTNAIVTVVRANTSVGMATIGFATSNLTAIGGVDYIATNGTLTFLDGENTKTILIPIVDDSSVEGDETFTVHLRNPGTGATIGDTGVATVTIIDNDAGLKFSSPSYSVSESGVSATFTVLRTAVTNTTVSVNYATGNGTATDGQDYIGSFGTLTFTNGETAKTFSVVIIDDTAIEGDETVLLTLSSPSASSSIISPGAAVLTILDNDGSLIVPAGSALISESGPTNGVIDPSETVSLYFAFRNTVGTDTANLVATLLSGNGVTAPGSSQNYGSLKVGGASVSRAFSFTAAGTNGQQIMATFQLQDGSFDLGTATFAYTLGSTTVGFSNATAIVINDSSSPPTISTPYPSTINVSGIAGALSKVSVTLSNLSHTFPDDIDILLVSPSGQKIVLMSDAGGGSGNPISNRTLTFDDSAAGFLPDSTLISSGTYKPTDYSPADTFPNPAPAGPYASTLSVLNGSNPNGTWSLYVVDDLFFNSGSIAQGWSLAITTSSGLASTADLSLSMTDSPDPAATGNDLTYTLTVTNHGPSTATGLVITNLLPAGVTFVSQNGNCTNSNNSVVCPLVSLPKDGVFSFNIVASPNAIGLITNTAFVSGNEADPNMLNNTASAVTTVDIPRADLAVTMSDSPDPVEVGTDLTYSVVVSNLGPVKASNIVLTNTLPIGSTLRSAFSSDGTWDTNTLGRVIFNWSDLPLGSSHLATIVVRFATSGIVTNSATAGSSTVDPFKANNTAAVKTTVQLPPFDLAPAADGLSITWGTNAPGYQIQSTTNLANPSSWTAVTNSPVIQNGKNRVIINYNEGSRFFRLGVSTP